MVRVKRIWYLSHMRAAKVQASLRIRAVSPEPPLLAHTSNESRGTFRQKARSLASLNGWACAVKICHDGMLEDTNSLDGAQMQTKILLSECQSRDIHVRLRHTCKTGTDLRPLPWMTCIWIVKVDLYDLVIFDHFWLSDWRGNRDEFWSNSRNSR